MGLSKYYTNGGDSPINSYDFLELATGLGYGTFYGNYASGATITSILTSTTIQSHTPSITFSQDSTTPTLGNATSWDLTFNIPQIIANAPIITSASIEDTNAANTGMIARMDVEIYHVNTAGTATLQAQASGAIINITGNATKSARLTTPLTTPRKKYGVGEKLRVKTSVFTYRGGAGSSSTWRLWTDSGNRGTTTYNQIDPDNSGADLGYKNPTDLKVLVPFEPDI